MKIHICSALLFTALCLSLSSGQAQAQPQRVTGEFAGTAIETFEGFSRDNVQARVNVPLPIFSGLGAISGPNEYIWINDPRLAYPGTFGLGPYTAKSHDGNQGYGTGLSYGTSHISFSVPVLAFGGFWASAEPETPIVFNFYDLQGALLGTDSVRYSAPNHDGTLEWFGWQSPIAIGSIDYSGAWVVNDSLRFTAVPEPASALILLIGGALLLAFKTQV